MRSSGVEKYSMKKNIFVALSLFITTISFAQLSAGLAYGTFNVPGADEKFKGYGPSLCIAYTGGKETQQGFLNASLYNKAQTGLSGIYDDQGQYIGDADVTKKYSIKHIQLGFKQSLAGDFTDSRMNCFLGGGVAVSFVKTTNKYSLPGYTIPDDKLNRTLWGFHFNTGGQLRLKPVVLELSGNFDLVLKPITTDGGDNVSNILTSLRLAVFIPIIKY